MLTAYLSAGYPYQKVGIFITKFTPESARQMYLLEDMTKCENMLKISKIADKLNNIMGKDVVRFAAMGYERAWRTRQGYLSKKFTTRIEDVLVVSGV
jgi:DNA polymerase V